MSRTLALIFSLCLSSTALAQSQDTDIRPYAEKFTTEELRETFSDATFDGAYGFARNGKARSFYVENHKPDGTVTYTEDGLTMAGTWKVTGDSLCFTYESDQMSGGCFRVYEVGNCLYFYSSSIPQVYDMTDRIQWIARAVRMGETPQCDAPMS